ncbi:hypothetical protein F8M41_001837 [Gigaspora margarita]|uniref:Uncharacterized protein n=1 Tax=Gigaspora margarita TaxID=4874 RepID=A0A8H4AYS7_GIGMA|nr:hypothetical protein F8M41_001837 [Gigaspora margarita]
MKTGRKWNKNGDKRTENPTLLLGLNEEKKSLIPNFDELIPENKKLFFEYSSIVKVLSHDLTKGVKNWLKDEGKSDIFLSLYLH